MKNDYENLLGDWIESSLSDNSGNVRGEVTGSLKFREYASNGIVYHVPVGVRNPQYYFISLKLSYNWNEIESDSEGNVLVEPESADCYTLELEFDSLYQKNPHRKSRKVVTALYREGCKEPVSVVTMDCDTCRCILWNDGYLPLDPGNYFLLISNAEVIDEGDTRFDTIGNCHRFFFCILPHGSRLKHPELKSVSFSSDRLLTVQMDRPVSAGRDCFGVCVYNGTGRVMVAQRCVPYESDSLDEIKMRIDSGEWWLDGSYTFVLLHNDEPFASFGFGWKHGEVTDGIACKVLERNTRLYMMVQRTLSDPYWDKLAGTGGYSAIAAGILDMFCRNKQERSPHCAIGTGLPYLYERIWPVVSVLTSGAPFDSCHCGTLLYGVEEGDGYLDCIEEQTVCLHHLSFLFTPEGAGLLSEVERKLQEDSGFRLVLYGTSEELDRLFMQSSVLAAYIPVENRWKIQPYTWQEQVYEFKRQIEDVDLVFSDHARETLLSLLTGKREEIKTWGNLEIAAWIENIVIPGFRRRVLSSRYWAASQSFFTTLEGEDIRLDITDLDAGAFTSSLTELNAMVGLTELKKSLVTVFNRTRFEERRRLLGLPVQEKGGYHMIFTGNPGTGKTTVAKLIGRVFHSMGLLSKGEVIEAERSSMIGRYIGDTELKMKELLERAEGNVLFIDEAYSLCDNNEGDRKDYGCRVLGCLLTVLTKKNPDMIVIMAGYEKEMDRMLELNPGMKGRFPYRFRFDDYNADELYRIACSLLARADYVLSPEADDLLRSTIQDAVVHKDEFFHNARWVEQYVLDGVISAMSDRVMSLPFRAENRELYQTIEAQDVREAYLKMRPQSVPVMTSRKRIGFVA